MQLDAGLDLSLVSEPALVTLCEYVVFSQSLAFKVACCLKSRLDRDSCWHGMEVRLRIHQPTY